MTEANIQREIMLACSERGDLIWRNNTGLAWQGSELKWRGRDLLLTNARPVRFGLAKGGSDLIGIRHMMITPEHVGIPVGVFMALEAKTKHGRPTTAQAGFIGAVNDAGGIAKVVRGVGDVP